MQSVLCVILAVVLLLEVLSDLLMDWLMDVGLFVDLHLPFFSPVITLIFVFLSNLSLIKYVLILILALLSGLPLPLLIFAIIFIFISFIPPPFYYKKSSERISRPKTPSLSDIFGRLLVPVYVSFVLLQVSKEKLTELLEQAKKTAITIDKVDFSAIAPKQILPGERCIIDLLMYAPEYRHKVNKLLNAAAKETESGFFEVPQGVKVKVVLISRDIGLCSSSEERVWNGGYLHFTFPVTLPDDYPYHQILFLAELYLENLLCTRLSFVAECASENVQKLKVTRSDIHSAFVSYARENMKEVVGRIQTIRKYRPDLDLFFDKNNLRSGERWESRLKQEIEKRDILCLCWSKAASESEWVEKEWRYALELKGLDGIDPLPLEKIPPCPSPPKELKSLHFQDPELYYQ